MQKRGEGPHLARTETPFVVARVNYTRFSKATSFDFDETLDKIIASAQKFNVERVNQQDVAKAGGGPPPEVESLIPDRRSGNQRELADRTEIEFNSSGEMSNWRADR